MGNIHGDKWATALPWVLMGKRTAFQPDLDTSAAMLTLGKSPQLPSQLLGDPGPPLNSLEVKALLEELYKMSAQPALPTSSVHSPIDIAFTDKISHVYVKVENPTGLSGRFEGPYEIISRPSRSQIQVRIGSYASGAPRLQTYNWQSCKAAHLREGQEEGSRPSLGRKPHPKPSAKEIQESSPSTKEIQGSSQPTKEIQGSSLSSRPQRSTRNQNPLYIDAIAAPG